jgi:hypothetical protein
VGAVSPSGTGGHSGCGKVTAFLALHANWAVLGVGLSAALLVVLNDRRALASLLAFQYLLAGWLSGLSLGLQVAAAQVAGGWIATAILGVTWLRLRGGDRPGDSSPDLMSRPAFRWVSVLLVVFAAWGLSRRDWLGLPNLSDLGTQAATVLMLLGLLQMSFFRGPIRVVIGMLTLLSGFGIAYAALETSLAVIGLIIVIHLGVALAGSYLRLGVPASGSPEASA